MAASHAGAPDACAPVTRSPLLQSRSRRPPWSTDPRSSSQTACAPTAPHAPRSRIQRAAKNQPDPTARATAAGVTPRTSAIAAPLSSPAKACAIAGRTRARAAVARGMPRNKSSSRTAIAAARAAAKARAAEGCTPWPWNQRSTPPIAITRPPAPSAAAAPMTTRRAASRGGAPFSSPSQRTPARLARVSSATAPRMAAPMEPGPRSSSRIETIAASPTSHAAPPPSVRSIPRPRRHGLAAPTLRGRLHGAAAYAPMSGLERACPRGRGGW